MAVFLSNVDCSVYALCPLALTYNVHANQLTFTISKKLPFPRLFGRIHSRRILLETASLA